MLGVGAYILNRYTIQEYTYKSTFFVNKARPLIEVYIEKVKYNSYRTLYRFRQFYFHNMKAVSVRQSLWSTVLEVSAGWLQCTYNELIMRSLFLDIFLSCTSTIPTFLLLRLNKIASSRYYSYTCYHTVQYPISQLMMIPAVSVEYQVVHHSQLMHCLQSYSQ